MLMITHSINHTNKNSQFNITTFIYHNTGDTFVIIYYKHMYFIRFRLCILFSASNICLQYHVENQQHNLVVKLFQLSDMYFLLNLNIPFRNLTY